MSHREYFTNDVKTLVSSLSKRVGKGEGELLSLVRKIVDGMIESRIEEEVQARYESRDLTSLAELRGVLGEEKRKPGRPSKNESGS